MNEYVKILKQSIDRRRRPTFTWMTAEVADGALAAVDLHHLTPR